MSEEKTNGHPKLDERFMVNLKGKDFVLYIGLLDLAHQIGLKSLEVETLQMPSEENHHVAICRAVATTDEGRTFTDVGDANPSNVNKQIAPHILRMASTRAKARALRDLTNVGMTCLEELAEVDDAPGEKGKAKTKATEPKSAPEGDTRKAEIAFNQIYNDNASWIAKQTEGKVGKSVDFFTYLLHFLKGNLSDKAAAQAQADTQKFLTKYAEYVLSTTLPVQKAG